MVSPLTPRPKKTNIQKEKNPILRSWNRWKTGFHAIDIFLHKKRSCDGVWTVLKSYRIFLHISQIAQGIKRFFTKKRTLRETWQGFKTGIVYFFEESTPLEIRPPRNWFEKHQDILWDIIILSGAYIFLFCGLKMEWFLKDIIPIGGDVPYHVANYFDFKEILLPHFQISGWSDASFGGFQLFQLYPVFPFILIYFFDLFVGSGVAFKAVLILGAVGLPLATYWTLLQAKVPRPGPIFGVILSLAYLFHDDHFAFGGNLRSVFSGEFAHSLSILLLMISCGFMAKAFENKKYITHTIIILALVGFSHPISFAVGIFLPLGFLLHHEILAKKGTLAKKTSTIFWIMIVSGLLFCTWAIGYYINHKYTGMGETQIVHSGYGWGITFNYLLPKLLLPFAILFLMNVIYYLFNWKKMSSIQVFFLWGTWVSIMFFLMKFMGFAIRFLPLIYLFGMLFVASTLGEAYRNSRREFTKIVLSCVIIASATFIFYYVDSNGIFQRYRGTSGHNFIGAESRGEWKSEQLTSEFLSKNFDTQTDDGKSSYPPRVFSYFRGDLFRVTSRASMYDSLFSHSLFTTQGIWTGRQIDKKTISVEKFWNYMNLSNTKIVFGPKELTDTLEKFPQYFRFLKTFDRYKIFETKNTPRSYIVPLPGEVYAIPDLTLWKKTSEKWYGEYSEKSPFIVYAPGETSSIFRPYDAKNTPFIPYKKNCKVQEFVQRENIRIHTDCIDRPLLIKFAYHQNWKVTGADGVYLATPAFMVVVPKQNEVTLHYGKRPYNYLAYACGILGLILLFSYSSIENIYSKGKKKLQKKYKKVFLFCSYITEKTKIIRIRNYLFLHSTQILLVFTVLVSIAFVYTNKG